MEILDNYLIFKIRVPAGGFERPTARSSAECSPRLSYAGTTNLLSVEELKVVFILQN
jgi:hypothetical protein